ncbi:hypothetical protein ATZ33_09925 [Enterococcus silesiacus]|uniref:Uncharacterized protein n=1 Tax=Enterococcus silesiacus TaxID=332949 RepID=A0ABM5W8S9_9ENTE|nr:hypothetical protein ATZ33_09925 [Enterococcus silesiacus]
MGQKCLTPRNKREFTKIVLQIFVNFSLFPKGLLLLPPFIRIPSDWVVTRRVMSQSLFSSFCQLMLSKKEKA